PASLPYHPPPTTPTSTLSLHDALPICGRRAAVRPAQPLERLSRRQGAGGLDPAAHAGILRRSRHRPAAARRGERDRSARAENHADRKSTRLISSHVSISYAVFCLKKKK